MGVCDVLLWSFGIGQPEKISKMGRNLATLNYDKVKIFKDVYQIKFKNC